MKRKITKLMAAFALLAFLAVPMGMRGQTTVTDELTYNLIGQTGTGYSNWSDVTSNSDAVWAGNSAGGNSSIQLRSNNNNSGIVTTASGGSVTSVTITWNENTNNARVLQVYGKNTAYSAATDLYNASTQGTLIGEIAYNANPVNLEVTDSYQFIGFRSESGAMYIDEIEIVWTPGATPPTTYTVTYNANVTGVAPVVDTYAEGTNVTLRGGDTFTNEGFTFEEWNTDANGDGDAYSAGDVIEGIDDNIELYAIWTESTTPGGGTATLNIQAYATANNWENGTKYTTAIVDPVTFTANGGGNTGKYYTSGQEWRYYQGESASITISVPEGYTLVSVTPTYNVSNGGVLKNGDTTIASGTTVDVSGTSVAFTVGNSGTATNGQVKFTNIVVTYVSDGGTPTPYISAENVEIAYDATNGLIEYTINNEPDPAGTLTASTESDWLTLGTVGETVPFTCTANDAAAERTATVILTYTYDDNQTVTKEVTVTQAGNPNIVDNISDITQVGANYNVKGMVVATNNRGFIICDGTGLVYTYLNAVPTQQLGDYVRISGTTGSYGHVIQFTNTATINEAESFDFEWPEYSVITEIPNYTEGNHLSDYFQFEGNLTKSGNNYLVAVGEGQIRISYPTESQSADLETLLNKTVRIHGFFTGYSGTGNNAVFTAMMESYEEVVTPDVPSVTVTPTTVNFAATGTEGFQMENLTIAYANIEVTNFESFTVQFYDNQGNETEMSWLVAGVTGSNAEGYVVSCVVGDNNGEARTVYFKVYAYDAENNKVYSELVTVNQEEYVAPTYAELPFAFNSGHDAIEDIDGLSQNGLGPDYDANTNPNTQLKFDGTGDWLLLQFDERPGTLTFDIKNNSFSGGTFKVQTSEDGVTYTDLETYTEITGTQNEEFTDLGENVRYIKWIYTEKVSGNVGLGNIALDAYEVPVIGPSITVTPDNYELDANAHSVEYLTTLAYENIVIVPESTGNFGIQYCDAEGNPTEHSWCGVSVSAVENSDDFQLLLILATANDGNEARTAYFKVFGHDAEDNVVYSNLVTITQAAPVIDYAVLPFVWEGGPKADFLALNGVTSYGLGSDYAAGNSPYLIKFDGTGDYIQVKTNSQPGKVTIGVKMIGGGDTSNITIQGSADGETFTDIEELEISGAQDDVLTLETTNAFADADRYVRMVFTKGSNVGVGPITIEKGNAPSITVTPSTVDLEAAGQVGETGYQMQSLTVTYNNLEITQAHDFAVQFYNAEGEEQTQPSWIEPDPTVVSGGNDLGYMVMLMIAPNEGPARSAYFKVYALGEEDYVYSNLVTINQAGVAQQYTLTVEPFENLELITFVNDEMVMEADGETQANEGDQIMLSIVAAEGYVMETLMVNGVNHVNDIADDFTYTFEMPAENVTISATAAEVVPFAPTVYTRATSITPGAHYIIVGFNGNDAYAMGTQNSNNRAAVIVSENGTEATVVNENVYDFVISYEETLEGTDYYSIYDAKAPGYLYAAGSSSNNLRTEVNLTVNSKWAITFENDGQANVVASKSTNRKVMQFNRSSSLFSCYASASQSPVYLYVKSDEVPANEEITVEGTDFGTAEAPTNAGYNLIASPFNNVNPQDVAGMLSGNYDLYYFDQNGKTDNELKEWRNYKVGSFLLKSGKGYLYASEDGASLNFIGAPYAGDGEVALDYTEGNQLAGWNLIGNPFNTTTYLEDGRSFYVLDETGAELIESSGSIGVMQGLFVKATATGETVTFTTTAPQTLTSGIHANLSSGSRLIDRAMIRFDEGSQLPKFQLNPDNTKLYITEDNLDYAVVNSNSQGETTINFKASKNGTYTISIEIENAEMNYLHLIDNMTGADIDLLQTQSYSFEARTSDYASRFRLVFRANSSLDEQNAETFAFFNGNEWVVSNTGEATLQVVDMMGRVLSSETVNGNATMNINQTPGVYMFRLINGDSVKVQKVVVR